MNQIQFPTNPANIDPERLRVALEDSGWRPVGGRRGEYLRIAPPSDYSNSINGWALLLPLDRSDPGYEEVMASTLEDLHRHTTNDFWSRILFSQISNDLVDTFRFTKESAAPPGLIPWKQGEDLIVSSRSTLLAGAKAYREKSRRFSNRLGQFAGRYLDSVMMGQTAVGSYVVTAYTPVDAQIPLSSSNPPQIEPSNAANSRGVSIAVSHALEATLGALGHYRKTGTFSAFEAGVQDGVSYDLAWALHRVTSDSDGAEIKIEWDQHYAKFHPGKVSQFEFKGSDSSVLERAAYQLASNADSSRPITVIGRVHLLTKQVAGGPGVFGIETTTGARRRYRVRLADTDHYHLAVKAHKDEEPVKVTGDLEPEGTIQWVYSARIDLEIDSADITTAVSFEQNVATLPTRDTPPQQLSIEDLLNE